MMFHFGAGDERVRKARAEPWERLRHAYRDPGTAGERLKALVKGEGWRGAAQRIDAEPEQLGRLHGREGVFSSRSVRLDRLNAVSAAWKVGASLTRVAEEETRAERDYRESVAAQIERDKVGVPKLSPEAVAVLEWVHRAARRGQDQAGDYWAQLDASMRTAPAVARAWEAGRRDPTIAAEIDRFQKAAEQRLGTAGIAAAMQSACDGRVVGVPEMEREQLQAFAQMARGLAAARKGRSDFEAQLRIEQSRQIQREHEHARYRRGPSLGMGR